VNYTKNAEEVARKKTERKKWKELPLECCEYLGKEAKDYICHRFMVSNGYKIDFLKNIPKTKKDVKECLYLDHKNIILGSIYLELFDFKLTEQRYNKEYSYLKVDGSRIKYLTGDKPPLKPTKTIGIMKFDAWFDYKLIYEETYMRKITQLGLAF